ncbi:MAG TPA: HD domain-containing protein [Candidatus Krumholzibacteriaceae bacterium]|nr:HD domain-containing protein [Candidatus Krumholzibacteriaceae bacterium]
MQRELLDRLMETSKRLQRMNGCHGFEHTERVVGLCMVLGERLSADMSVLIPAAILHDVGRGEDSHAEKGAEKARRILTEHGVHGDRVTRIVETVRVHSFSGGLEASSLEAKILSDADKLDAMGAVGVYRAAQYSGEHDRPIERYIGHFHEKLLTLKELLYTDVAKKLAETRHSFMESYLEEFMKELKAEA